MRAGMFLSRRPLPIPDSRTVDGRGPEFYTLANLYIGAHICAFGRIFRVKL